jgi:small subunit ribosomal protein S20
MAHHKSAVKRNRQSLEARERNRKVRSTMRTEIKRALATVTAGEATPNAGTVQSAVKLLAKAAKKRVLHKKTASRRVSRLMKAANRTAK